MSDPDKPSPEPGAPLVVAPVVARVCAAVAVLLGALVLVGWALGIEALRSPISGKVSMKPNTALSFVLLGGAFLLLLVGNEGSRLRTAGRVLALAPAIVGLLTLVEYVFDRDLGIDQLLFRDVTAAVATAAPGRMSPLTALCFLVFGSTLLLLDRPHGVVLAQVLAAVAGFLGLLGLLPYLYGLPVSSGLLARQTQMAAHTAVGMVVLGAGVLLARPGRGPMAFVGSDAIGGSLTRRLLPVAVGLPVAAGWLAVGGQRLGLYDAGFRVSVVATGSAAALTVLTWVGARSAHRVDLGRRQAERTRLGIFRVNPSPVFFTRVADGRFVDVNDGFVRTFGWTRDELLGRTSTEINLWPTPEDRERVVGMLRERGTVEGLEVVLQDRRGRSLSMLHAAKIVDFEGDPHIVGTLQDITERKRAEETLRQREATLREAQRIAHMGSWTLDSATNHVSWTDELYLMLGLEPGLPPPDYTEHQRLFTPESWARLTTALSRTQETGVPYELELEMVRADGSTGWMLACGEPVRDASGVIVGLRGVAQDITERKLVEDEVRRSAGRLEGLNAISRDMLATGSTEELARAGLSHLRGLVPCLRASLSRFDPASQEVVLLAVATDGETGVGPGTRVPLSAAGPEDRLLRGEINLIADTLEVEDPAPEIRRLIDEGVRMYVDVPMVSRGELIGTVNVSSGTPGGFTEEQLEAAREVVDLLTVAVVHSELRDELRRHAEELEQEVAERTAEARAAKEEAERANRAKDEFLSRMSHELRTPLNSVLGFAQVLELDGLEPVQLESVGQILKAGRHLLELVDEVLDISRIGSGTLSLSLEPVEISGVVRESLALLRPLADERGVTLRVEEADGLHVMADRRRLEQVVLNLLSNAVKFNREAGEVRVSWEASPGDRVCLHVEDQGPGVPADRMERVFVPFDRLGAEQTGVEGTGLGLSLSRALVEAMGGTIGVASVPGRGSVFTVNLALAEPPIRRFEETRLHPVAAHRTAETRTVLYVEDNLSNLELVERILERLPGTRLLSAMQGRLGLELARQHRPDLILLDLHLPDISGEEALHALREDPATSDIPVVVISADAMPGTMRGLLAAGASDYLTKPLDIQKFLEVVGGALGRV